MTQLQHLDARLDTLSTELYQVNVRVGRIAQRQVVMVALLLRLRLMMMMVMMMMMILPRMMMMEMLALLVQMRCLLDTLTLCHL